jgi:hypothetical protein
MRCSAPLVARDLRISLGINSQKSNAFLVLQTVLGLQSSREPALDDYSREKKGKLMQYSTCDANQLDCLAVINGVRAGDHEPMGELYRLISISLRSKLKSHIGSDACGDAIHDIYLLLVDYLRAKDFRRPEGLKAFIGVLGRRYILDTWHAKQRAAVSLTGLGTFG